MQITISSPSPERVDDAYTSLLEDFQELNLSEFRVETKSLSSSKNKPMGAKGDPVTISAIVLALVSTGGALTVAVGKEGALSRIAAVLESYVKRNIQISIKADDGTEVDIIGPAKNIERILLSSVQKESAQ